MSKTVFMFTAIFLVGFCQQADAKHPTPNQLYVAAKSASKVKCHSGIRLLTLFQADDTVNSKYTYSPLPASGYYLKIKSFEIIKVLAETKLFSPDYEKGSEPKSYRVFWVKIRNKMGEGMARLEISKDGFLDEASSFCLSDWL